jgi:hypothetical protein
MERLFFLLMFNCQGTAFTLARGTDNEFSLISSHERFFPALNMFWTLLRQKAYTNTHSTRSKA